MPVWSRIVNVFCAKNLARKAPGSPLRGREANREGELIAWADSLRSDVVFGWRQLKKHKIASAAVILSLGIAIGACAAAFRLIDALLLRPLPIAGPERLYTLSHQGIKPDGKFRISDSSEYPLFERMRSAVHDRTELIAVSYADRTDLTFGSDEEMEKAHRQYVSGWMFKSFGLQPAIGRLFNEDDDRTPGARAYAVLSHDYWTRRFGRDPEVVGRKFRMGSDLYEIAGVAPEGFSGTEPGTVIDIFIPTMMHAGVLRPDWSWFRTLVRPKPGTNLEPVLSKLQASFRSFQEERARGWSSQSKQFIARFLDQTLLLAPAPAGVSDLQKEYRRSLLVLGALVGLVMLIACANVANLMTAQAAARAREMALRVSIGAGRWRLAQLVMVESAWLGMFSAGVGAVFAWWAAPFVAGRINPPGNPARLLLPMDWRVLVFGTALALCVTLLFGLAPALRASSIKPASALKGGGNPQSRGGLMRALVAVQVAFCFIVHFAAGLFVVTFDRLAHEPVGFSAEGLLLADTVARRAQAPAVWDQAAEHLRSAPGIRSVALAGWPLLSGNGWNGFIWVNGTPTEVLAYFLAVSPGWIDTMGIPLLDGRDLRSGEAHPSVAIVNEAFAKQCFRGADPIGKWFEKETGDGVTRMRLQVVGVLRDAR